MIFDPSPILASVGRTEERSVTELRNLPEGWLAVGAFALTALLLWAVIWMYRHEHRKGATGRVRSFLAVVRCAVVLALVLILLEPVRVKIIRRWIDSYTVVLVDNSSSMDLADHYRDQATLADVESVLGTRELSGVRRADIAGDLLSRDDGAFFNRLSHNNRVKVYTFADAPELQATLRAEREADVGPSDGSDSTESSPEDGLASEIPTIKITAGGPATNLERAFRRSIESLAGAPVAGVVTISDGVFNQGASAEEVARYARERNIPIHTIGLGDPSPPRNVRVTEIMAPENVFQKDPFAITVSLAGEGITGERLHVILSRRDSATGAEIPSLDTADVSVGPGGTIEPIKFERSADRVGRYVYTVSVAPLPGETVSEDNTKQTTVSVLDARTRVLIVAGEPSWNYRYLTRLLERDDTFSVSCWLQSADYSAVRDGDIVIDHLPISAEELFEYDVVVLLDPDPSEFTFDWAELVERMVSEYGGGMLYLAARPYASDFFRAPAVKPIVEILPVSPDPEADLILNQIGHYQTSPSPIEIPEAAYANPIMRMGDDPVATKLAWQGLGGVYWHYPVLREKPVATALIRHGGPRMRNAYGGHVLAAVQFVGAGRSGFLGFDSFSRWRREGETVYNRFWIQFIRTLAEGKLVGGSKRATLQVENEHPSIGEAITLSARLLNHRYEPWKRDEIKVRFEIEGERGDFTLTPRADRAGWYEGRFVPTRIGSYRLTLAIPEAEPDEPQTVEQEVIVSRPNLEILHPQMDKVALEALAKESGGRYWMLGETEGLADAIPDLHEEIPIRSRPVSLWDNWKTLAVLIGLLAIEWGVRKWNRLL